MDGLQIQDIRLGIIASRSALSLNPEAMHIAMGMLIAMGCKEENMISHLVPADTDIPLTAKFFAEYTSVDGLVVITRKPEMSIENHIIEVQLDWDLPIEIRYANKVTEPGIIEMLMLQDALATLADMDEDDIPIKQKGNVN